MTYSNYGNHGNQMFSYVSCRLETCRYWPSVQCCSLAATTAAWKRFQTLLCPS